MHSETTVAIFWTVSLSIRPLAVLRPAVASPYLPGICCKLAHGAQGMRESYRLYQTHLSSHLPQLARSVPLAGPGQGADGHRRASRPLATDSRARQKVSAIATDAASLLGALAQWVVLLMLIMLVYCWWHRTEAYWGLPPSARPLLDRLASLQTYHLQASHRSGWTRRPWKYNSI